MNSLSSLVFMFFYFLQLTRYIKHNINEFEIFKKKMETKHNIVYMYMYCYMDGTLINDWISLSKLLPAQRLIYRIHLPESKQTISQNNTVAIITRMFSYTYILTTSGGLSSLVANEVCQGSLMIEDAIHNEWFQINNIQ